MPQEYFCKVGSEQFFLNPKFGVWINKKVKAIKIGVFVTTKQFTI